MTISTKINEFLFSIIYIIGKLWLTVVEIIFWYPPIVQILVAMLESHHEIVFLY